MTPLGRILLVDPYVDSLAALGTALRDHGFHVVLANSATMACERAGNGRFDFLVLADELVDPEIAAEPLLDALSRVMTTVPPHVVLVRDLEANWSENALLRGDVEGVVSRALAVAPASRPVPSVATPSSRVGALGDTPLLEIVRGFHGERETGTLSITTGAGAGELRLSRGELVDAVYLGLEGRKALLRMLIEGEGSFVFTTSTPIVMRRLTTPHPRTPHRGGARDPSSRRTPP